MTLSNSTAKVTLNDGNQLPYVGLGTWQSKENDAYKAVVAALKAGYRHIDTAAIYGNEEEVGRAIKDSGVRRSEIFVTTKLWGTQHRHPDDALNQSLERLGLDYVDLYLMHWPVPINDAQCKKDNNYLQIPMNEDGTRDLDLASWDFIKTWELMQALPKSKVKSIGVSNFSINNIKDLLASPGNKEVPVVNQVELHPLLPQFELVEFCKSKNIVVEAYSPLGSTGAPILELGTINEVSKKLAIPPANVVFSWLIQRKIVVLPKSVTESRIISNLQTMELPAEEFSKLNNISSEVGEKRSVKPNWTPFIPFV
ncbi:hypothetical protein TPHA_0E01760 [Tetrapisispora phaffii CBS 4417]|uniref:NADP-dependent oxidoreductase domain-containing protein n=1 Tax=Tetrapisispora phaffii (strain ATCC 24235 / CBS 4417 / NBRC 1672 / NRRL Y-8282 / UCD 70-5) TaxID=1071381 RepID=G8BTP1_TETPH|nr:hypothetical protein TPHA_0E01760 [Tetrapisispora phaffii CBS 4417]CCE63269.1 hypothetical protein TPHA_0E01760 [Tetrapisispora phaffii CBS 4417]